MTGDARGHHGEAYERLLCQERLILDVTEQLAGALEDGGVTRAELARRLGRSPHSCWTPTPGQERRSSRAKSSAGPGSRC